MDMETMGERIRRARIEAGYENQVEFASLLGVDRGSISQWETDATVPRTRTLIEIARITGRSLDWLCCLKEKEPSKEAVDVSEKWDLLPLNAQSAVKGTIDAFAPAPPNHPPKASA